MTDHAEERLRGMDTGTDLHRWATDLFPLCRSLTGDGTRQTLAYLQSLLPDMTIHEVPSGTQVLDWTIPDEWNITAGYLEDASGRLIDFAHHNLHVVGYSEPIDLTLTREALDSHLYSAPELPDAIPYVTSYYRRGWGFCLTQRQRDQLGDGPFHAVIHSRLEPGSLTYGEVVLPGESDDEILLSTYVCHPSMANNELSGPVVTTALGRWLKASRRRFTYRLVFAPETIGSIAYMARHLPHLRTHVRAGWVVTCIGDERTYSYLPSRVGGTLADRVSERVLSDREEPFDTYSFLDRGSDERQWCSPGADLPVCSVMRSKYGTYPEYHTSLDDLGLVTPTGLDGGLNVLRSCIELVEANGYWTAIGPGEPQLGRRGLYPTVSVRGSADTVKGMMDVLAYCDGVHDVIDLSTVTGLPTAQVLEVLNRLETAGVVRRAEGREPPGCLKM
jgi:aminopeptidase-like protein